MQFASKAAFFILQTMTQTSHSSIYVFNLFLTLGEPLLPEGKK